jgi:hypothetical protein
VKDAQLRQQPMNQQTAMAQRRQHRVTVIQHLVRRGILLAVAPAGRPADGGKIQLPVTPRAIALVKHLLLERQFQMRRTKL